MGTDYNKILHPGEVEDGLINVVIEIPAGSNHKIEWNREKAIFQLDRVEPAIFAKPVNYGFIPQTLDEDGDELDALILTDDPLPTGVCLEARILGVMRFEDSGEVDDKILAVPAADHSGTNAINSFKDLPPEKIYEITHHFNHYKDHKNPESTEVKSWGDIEEAKTVVYEAVERWNKEYK